MQSNFPPPLPSQEIIGLALNALNRDAGVLALIAIIMAIIGGMGLFIAIEGKFALIYQIRTRGILRQYIMALGMLLVFVIWLIRKSRGQYLACLCSFDSWYGWSVRSKL